MKELLDDIWPLTHANDIELWGVSTSSNGLFMQALKSTVTIGIVKCTGQLMGYRRTSPGAIELNFRNVNNPCTRFEM